MAIVRDLKTGEFLEIPDKDAKKFVIPADKVRESLQAAGIGGEPGPAAPEGGFQGPLPNLVLNLNLNELLARGGGQMPMQMPMPQPMPAPAMAGPGPMAHAGHHGPRVAPQWWVGPLGGIHPGGGWGWHHPYYGWHYGW